jgi:predicted nucleic acid-binding protein
MIVVDTSALIAILDRQPDAALYAEAIAEADSPLISAATLLELHIVMLNRRGARAAQIVDRLRLMGRKGTPSKSSTRWVIPLPLLPSPAPPLNRYAKTKSSARAR